MAVLLIGSTGNGKSTLGNFLFDPSPNAKEYFEVVTDNLPKTHTCKVVTLSVKYRQSQGQGSSRDIRNSHDTSRANSEDSSSAKSSISSQSKGTGGTTTSPGLLSKISKAIGVKNEDEEVTGSLTVIDTPGINESKEKDLECMTDLVTTLKEQQTIRACIFVMKFSAKIDQQYRDTIKCYSTLLPSLFSKNCLIVLTHYATDRRSEILRRKKGFNYDSFVKNIKEEIKKSSGIRSTPTVFSIDSVPFEDEELRKSRNVRDAMLSYIFSLKEVHLKEFRVAKTRVLQSEDQEEINAHKEKINGYNKKLLKESENAKEALLELQSKGEAIATIKTNLCKQEESLRNKDSDDLVTAHVWSVDEEWKFFKWQEKEFDETSKYEIHGVKRWTNGHCRWKEFIQEGNRVHGVVEGEFMYGLHASITLETKKRIKYAEDIENLKKNIKLLGIELHEAKVAEEECSKKYSKIDREKSALEKCIQEKKELIECLSLDTMTLEQAKARLEKQRSTTSQ